MARLPTTLEQRPTPRSQRRVHGYQVTKDPLSQVGEAVGGIGKLMEQKDDERQKFNAAKAKSHVLQESIRIKSELEKDNDYTTWDKRYSEQMKPVKDSALNMVNAGQYREYLNLDIENNMARDAGSINTKANLRQKEVDISGMNEAVEKNKRAYVLATDPKTRAEIMSSTNILHDTAQRNGYVVDKEAENRKFVDAVTTERANILAPEQKVALLAPTSYKDGVPVFEETKTWVDAIPPQKRMDIYSKGVAESRQLEQRSKENAFKDFYKAPSKEGLENLKIIKPDMRDSTIERLTNIYESTPDYEATTTFSGYERAYSDIQKLSSMPNDTIQQKEILLDKTVGIVNKMKRSNRGTLEKGSTLSQDGVDELSQILYSTIDDSVFKKEMADLPDIGVFEKIKRDIIKPAIYDDLLSETFKGMQRTNRIEEIGLSTSENMVKALLSGNKEQVNKIYQEGLKAAIKEKYHYIPEMQGELKENETMININGKPYLFKGFGSEDILLEMQN